MLGTSAFALNQGDLIILTNALVAAALKKLLPSNCLAGQFLKVGLIEMAGITLHTNMLSWTVLRNTRRLALLHFNNEKQKSKFDYRR
jgi:hypothetical protein